MSTTATLAQVTKQLISMMQLGSRGPVLLLGENYGSFDAANYLKKELQSIGVELITQLPHLGHHEDWLPRGTQHQVVFLHGLEYLAPDSVSRRLKTLNRRRDEIKDLAQQTIIWLPESELERFTDHCPDLFAWRAYFKKVNVPQDDDRHAHLELVACITRFDVGQESAKPASPAAFAPTSNGEKGPPRTLAWIVDHEQRTWLSTADYSLSRAALVTLAHERAWEWLHAMNTKNGLVIPLPLPHGGEHLQQAWAHSCLATHVQRVPAWIRSGWIAAFVVIDVEETLEVDLPNVIDCASEVHLAVLSRRLPQTLPPGFRHFEATLDLAFENRRLLLKAGLSEPEVARLEKLGVLTLLSDHANSLLALRERDGALPGDDLVILETIFPTARRRDIEHQALIDVATRSALQTKPSADDELKQFMLAARRLLDSDWIDALRETSLLTRSTAIKVLDLALKRRMRIYGAASWLLDLEALADGLTQPLEVTNLLLAALEFAGSIGNRTLVEPLVQRAQAHLEANAEHMHEAQASAPSDLQQSLHRLKQAVDETKSAVQSPNLPLRPPSPTFDARKHMNPSARKALSSTIRALRARLLDDLHAASESTYRLAVKAAKAGLDEATRSRRRRLEGWIAEQMRVQEASKAKGKAERSAEDFRREIEKQAAYTLLNRLVLLRLMEAPTGDGTPLRAPAIVLGGWESRGYLDFRQLAPALVRGDESEGYAFLLRLTFDDLATELPGLYGPAGMADLVPLPAATLRFVIDALNAPELDSCWTDDMTLGWVYQYWNDPEREALDTKLNGGGKLEGHEIASKTQMFTERYMVDWLLQNSLGPMWLAICKKHGWPAAVENDGVLATLEKRREAWRASRERGEVELDALMPLHSEIERRWAYYVRQPIPDDAIARAPSSLRELKLIDPAVGSGHFLVVALDLLVALYREEARHRGKVGDDEWRDRAIVERILSFNLHGIDLDPRAVQIAAAALWLKARQVSREAKPERLHLVASNLRLASLPDNDPALVELRQEIERETSIPAALIDTLTHALAGADHLGSLLKIDHEVDQVLDQHDAALQRPVPDQGGLFSGFSQQRDYKTIDRATARSSLIGRIETFLNQHTSGDDLGLRLRGEQLAAGVRFVRMVQEGTYDLVVANPPYQGTAKMADAKYIEKAYPRGKADLFAAFLERGLQLCKEGGVSAMLTMRNWMFLKQYSALREGLLKEADLRLLGDASSGAFEEISAAQVVVSVTMSIFRRTPPNSTKSVAIKLFDDRNLTQIGETGRKRAATLCQAARFEFEPQAFKIIPESPLVYWWSASELNEYARWPKLRNVSQPRQGLATADNTRFLRAPWETSVGQCEFLKTSENTIKWSGTNLKWKPFVNGAAGLVWFEPARDVIEWACNGLGLFQFARAVVRNPTFYHRPGIAFSMIGSLFTARAHRYHSIFGHMGSSVFPEPERIAETLCSMNSSRAHRVLSSLNPGVHFEVGDVNRLPLFPVANSTEIFTLIESAFTLHESHREPSVEFRSPGPSPWRHAQAWAQLAVDRPTGAPLPPYHEELDPEPASDHLSYALGVALGRFSPSGEGILDPTKADLSHALPAGLLFLDDTLDAADRRDSLGHLAATPLLAAWEEHGPALGTKRSLREWLALDFFKDVHKSMYENRPIHWPLSSANKTFVAWVNIHRFNAQTLRVLLADHLVPTLARLDGELNDLRAARDGADKKAARTAENRLNRALDARKELDDFIANVGQCADRGAPATESKCPAREQDARYAPDLDDGVMINSAALWPLLEPQWKEPKKWWKELATANGRKDYDWSHLAMRYWPQRVDRKCQEDPSLAVAHGCFWRYHPARAWTWELRLQDEIDPEFRIEEAPYRPGDRDLGDGGDQPHRRAWLADHADEALAAIEKEATRRMGRGKNIKLVAELRILETGLWSRMAAKLWDLELELAKKQGGELRIVAADEAQARAAFAAAHPDQVRAREAVIKNLVPLTGLFENTDDASGLQDEELDDSPEDDA